MLESTEDAAEAPPLMKKLSAAASSCQSAALSSSMASDSLAIRQASAQRVIRRESVEDPPLLGCMVVVVVQTDARVHTPGAGEGDEVPHLILLGFFQRVHIDRRSRRATRGSAWKARRASPARFSLRRHFTVTALSARRTTTGPEETHRGRRRQHRKHTDGYMGRGCQEV